MAGINKREKEKAEKEASKNLLKTQKQTKKEQITNSFSIKRNSKPSKNEGRPIILIVSEGEVTEVEYFEKFKLHSLLIVSVGTGYNTKSLVERSQREKQERIRKGIKIDQVWCVFDKDDFQDFDAAFPLAKEYGFEVAYSNQSFEFWFLLHFDFFQGQMNRNSYQEKLNNYLKKYRQAYKDKHLSQKLFDILWTFKETAIRNADKLERYFDEQDLPYSLRESSTTVHRLVSELLKYIENPFDTICNEMTFWRIVSLIEWEKSNPFLNLLNYLSKSSQNSHFVSQNIEKWENMLWEKIENLGSKYEISEACWIIAQGKSAYQTALESEKILSDVLSSEKIIQIPESLKKVLKTAYKL